MDCTTFCVHRLWHSTVCAAVDTETKRSGVFRSLGRRHLHLMNFHTYLFLPRSLLFCIVYRISSSAEIAAARRKEKTAKYQKPTAAHKKLLHINSIFHADSTNLHKNAKLQMVDTRTRTHSHAGTFSRVHTSGLRNLFQLIRSRLIFPLCQW